MSKKKGKVKEQTNTRKMEKARKQRGTRGRPNISFLTRQLWEEKKHNVYVACRY